MLCTMFFVPLKKEHTAEASVPAVQQVCNSYYLQKKREKKAKGPKQIHKPQLKAINRKGSRAPR